MSLSLLRKNLNNKARIQRIEGLRMTHHPLMNFFEAQLERKP
jgi:hypothetical protein